MSQAQSRKLLEKDIHESGALSFPCPACHAKIGIPCLDVAGARVRPHVVRVKKYGLAVPCNRCGAATGQSCTGSDVRGEVADMHGRRRQWSHEGSWGKLGRFLRDFQAQAERTYGQTATYDRDLEAERTRIAQFRSISAQAREKFLEPQLEQIKEDARKRALARSGKKSYREQCMPREDGLDWLNA